MTAAQKTPRVEQRPTLHWMPAQGHRTDHPSVPTPALLAALGIMLATLIFAFVASRQPEAGPAAPIVATRALSFELLEGGVVRVTDLETGAVAAVMPEAASGFTRGLMRAFERDRAPLGLSGPIETALTRDVDGRLALTDRATGRRIELVGFGRTHYEAFERLAPPEPRP